jgi:hypothetical protein
VRWQDTKGRGAYIDEEHYRKCERESPRLCKRGMKRRS